MTGARLVSSGPLRMTPEKARQILDEDVIPLLGAHDSPPRQPTYVVVAGQPGSGKSTTVRQAELDLEGATQKLIPDDFVAFVPGFYGRAQTDRIEAVALAHQADQKGFFCAGLMDHALGNRSNIVQEMAPPSGFATNARSLGEKGYRTELHVVATPRHQSLTGVLGRLDDDIRNARVTSNVFCPGDAHDQAYAGWSRAVFDAERKKQCDRVVIARRDGTIVYDNELTRASDGSRQWKKPPQALAALLEERYRPTGTRDAQHLTRTWKSIASNPVLARMAVTHREPIEAYRADVLRFASRDGASDDRGGPHGRSQAAKPDLLKIARDDLNFVVAQTEKQFGSSRGFRRAIEAYRDGIERNRQPQRPAAPVPERLPARPAAGGGGIRAVAEHVEAGRDAGPSRAGSSAEAYGSDPFAELSETDFRKLEAEARAVRLPDRTASVRAVRHVGRGGSGSDDEFGPDPFKDVTASELAALEAGAMSTKPDRAGKRRSGGQDQGRAGGIKRLNTGTASSRDRVAAVEAKPGGRTTLDPRVRNGRV